MRVSSIQTGILIYYVDEKRFFTLLKIQKGSSPKGRKEINLCVGVTESAF